MFGRNQKVNVKVVDNFLPLNELEELKQIMIYRYDFPMYYQDKVAIKNVVDDQPWNWYQTHMLYVDNHSRSSHYEPIANIFLPKLKDLRALIRIKANFYPYTETLREHLPHTDYKFKHTAAIFSVNTCDGFTRMEDGTKMDSVENRIIFFDGSTSHNSSTTTTSSARWNINFNFL
jgi:hypothetical protein